MAHAQAILFLAIATQAAGAEPEWELIVQNAVAGPSAGTPLFVDLRIDISKRAGISFVCNLPPYSRDRWPGTFHVNYWVEIPSTGGVAITNYIHHGQAVEWRDSLLLAARAGLVIEPSKDTVTLHHSLGSAFPETGGGFRIYFTAPIAKFLERWAEFEAVCAKPSDSE